MQVVHSESQENGQKEAKRSRHEELEEDDLQADGERAREHEEKMETSFPGAMETQSPLDTSHDVEINTGNGLHLVPNLSKIIPEIPFRNCLTLSFKFF